MHVMIPENDAERVEALRSYQVMNTPPEPAYDDITALAAKICECPTSFINLIDDTTAWHKSDFGVPASRLNKPKPRETSLCTNAVCSGKDLTYIPDLTQHELLSSFPSVVKPPHYRFYCAMPLVNPQGYILGTLCTVDYKPRELNPEQKDALRRLAGQVMAQMELRRSFIELEKAHQELKELNQTLEEKVKDQVAEVERVSRIKRFLSPQIAETVLQQGDDGPFQTHRREITAVFIDLRGFTAFTDSSEPEEVIEFLRCYHAEMGKLIFEHEGAVEHFAGDGIMAFFNDPVPRKDHTETAVRMSLEVVNQGKGLCQEWLRRGYDLDVGIGLSSGYATMGTFGFEGRMEYGAVGNVTILASRLSGEAKGGQILTDRRTLAKIDDLVETEPLGDMQLKGFSRPFAVSNITNLKG